MPYLLRAWQSLNSSSLSERQCTSKDLSLGGRRGGGGTWIE